MSTQQPLQSQTPTSYSRATLYPLPTQPPLSPHSLIYAAQPLTYPSPAYTGQINRTPYTAQRPPSGPQVAPIPSSSNPPIWLSATETTYKRTRPTIPKFSNPDPGEFARLRIALENLLPHDATELFSYQILIDHLKLDEAKLLADAYLNSPTPFSDTMAALHDKLANLINLPYRRSPAFWRPPRSDAVIQQGFKNSPSKSSL